MGDSQRKHWCWTMNNPTISPEQLVHKWSQLGATYVVIGKEVGKSGTSHYQGYTELSKVKRFSTLQKELPGIHLENRRGTPNQASDYCKKDGDFIEEGTLSVLPHQAGGQKRKAHWDDVRDLAKQKRYGDIAEKYPDIAIRYGNAIKKLGTFVNVPEVPSKVETEVYWFYGATRTGKSHRVRQMIQKDHYKKLQHQYWDDYRYQEDVFIEELRPIEPWLAAYFKIWLDVWDFKADVKHSSIDGNIRPKRIFVTSNYTIEEIFNAVDAPAIRERCVQIIHFISRSKIIIEKNALPSPPKNLQEAPSVQAADDAPEVSS